MSKQKGDAQKIELAQRRSQVYGLLSSVYLKEPAASLLRELRAPGFLEVLGELGLSFSKNFREAGEEELLERLAIEYTRLFLGPGPHINPYESVQRGEGRYWGDSTVEALEFFRKCGFDLGEKFTGMPDHLSVELELMSRLSAQEAEQWEKGDREGAERRVELQKAFLREHLLTWVPFFCQRVIEEAEEEFYRHFASLTREVLLSEARELLGLGEKEVEELTREARESYLRGRAPEGSQA
ncbi:MAG: molecular chaperone [Nitrospinota bacterium]